MDSRLRTSPEGTAGQMPRDGCPAPPALAPLMQQGEQKGALGQPRWDTWLLLAPGPALNSAIIISA